MQEDLVLMGYNEDQAEDRVEWRRAIKHPTTQEVKVDVQQNDCDGTKMNCNKGKIYSDKILQNGDGDEFCVGQLLAHLFWW